MTVADENEFRYSRKFGYSDTLKLFWRSPFINEIKEQVPLLIEKYHTMGCNFFCETFPEVEYVIFTDDIAPKVKNSTIVTWRGYFTEEHRLAHQTYPDYPKKDLYSCTEKIAYYPICKDKKFLYNFVHTPTMAFNWAYHNGFRNVVLAGIDLNFNEADETGKIKLSHFDNSNDENRYGEKAKKPGAFTKTYIKLARRHIMDVNEDYLNVFQLNPNNDIDIPKVSMSELL